MAQPTDPIDQRFMAAALALARRGLGVVWPNPAVGCVIVDGSGDIVGRGWTQPGGRPHAETEALARAGARARGATAYVSLEPCAHTGHTAPCAEALIKAGLGRVVVACEDPDPRVAGKGIELLMQAGINVRAGVMRHDAERLNAGFISRVSRSRPVVLLKVASTLDGRIATHRGESKWITGDLARSWGHAMRASHDALITGGATVRADNPDLTCRLPGMESRSPVRVVMDSRLSLPLTARIVATARRQPTWLLTCEGVDEDRRSAFADCGLEVIEVPPDDGGRPDVAASLRELAARGITRVMVEGGANLNATFFRSRLVDRVAWFRAPDVIGGDGLPAVQSFGVDHLPDMASFTRIRTIVAGRDALEIYERTGQGEESGAEG